MSSLRIRRADAGDLPALLDLYNYYVVNTPITFDIEPRTLAQRRQWFAQFGTNGRYQCFVAEADGKAIGYACSGRFKEKAAYDTSVETSVYVAPDRHRKGVGRSLYTALFEALKGEGVHRAYGGVTEPNPASVALHFAMGFRRIGAYHEAGRKFGRFWDVALFEREMV